MKIPAKSNIYSYAADAAWELYAPFLDGAQAGAVCVTSTAPLSEKAIVALTSSFEKLGYGSEACCFVSLSGTTGKHLMTPSEMPTLDAPSLMSIIEALDPRLLVSCDKQSSDSLSAVYRQEIPREGVDRLLGRTILTFESFEQMLLTPQGKQQAWALLKKLPRRN